MLPLNEMAAGQQSPYSAVSAMAIDPIFIRLPDVPEFAALGGEGGGVHQGGAGARRSVSARTPTSAGWACGRRAIA